METFRADTLGRARRPDRVRPGQPLALAPRHRARHPLPDLPRPGQARPRGARQRARRRGRPAPRLADLRRVGGASSSTTSAALMLWIPVGFGHGFCVLSDVADFVYKCTSYYDPATEAGFSFDDPDVGIEWPRRRADLLGARPRRAAAGRDRRLAAVHGVNGPLRAQPHGRPAPRQPAHGAAGVAVRALGRRRASSCAWRTSTPAACGPGYAEQQLADLAAIGLDWDGEVVFQSQRLDRYAEAIEALGDRVYECFCTRAEIREAASAPHGPLPEGAYPGTCLRLTAAELAEKRASGRAPALRIRAGAARVRVRGPAARPCRGRRRRLRRAPQRRRARLQPRGRGRRRGPGHRRGRARRRPARLHAAPALPGRRARPARSRRYAHVPLVLGPDGARLAKRHGDVTLREVEPAAARAWMLRTLGLSEGGRVRSASVAARADGL